MAIKQELACGDVFQARYHAQRGGLAASGRSDQHDQFAVFHVDIEIEHGLNVVVIYLIDML